MGTPQAPPRWLCHCLPFLARLARRYISSPPTDMRVSPPSPVPSCQDHVSIPLSSSPPPSRRPPPCRLHRLHPHIDSRHCRCAPPLFCTLASIAASACRIRKTSPGRLLTCLGSARDNTCIAPAAVATTLTAASFALDTLSVFPLCVPPCTRPGVSGCGGDFGGWRHGGRGWTSPIEGPIEVLCRTLRLKARRSRTLNRGPGGSPPLSGMGRASQNRLCQRHQHRRQR